MNRVRAFAVAALITTVTIVGCGPNIKPGVPDKIDLKAAPPLVNPTMNPGDQKKGSTPVMPGMPGPQQNTGAMPGVPPAGGAAAKTGS